jgi:hypothetical protein
MDYLSFTAGSVAGASLLAVAAWFLKRLIVAWIDMQVKRYEQETNRDVEIHLAKVRADLRITEIAKEVAFPKVYAKQFEVLDELYNKLIEMMSIAAGIIYGWSPGKPEDEKQKFRTAYFEAKNLYLKTSIYIPKKLADRIFSIVNKLNDANTEDSLVEMRFARKGVSDDTWEKMWARKEALFKQIDHEWPAVIESLRQHIRQQLGVEDIPPDDQK